MSKNKKQVSKLKYVKFDSGNPAKDTSTDFVTYNLNHDNDQKDNFLDNEPVEKDLEIMSINNKDNQTNLQNTTTSLNSLSLAPANDLPKFLQKKFDSNPTKKNQSVDLDAKNNSQGILSNVPILSNLNFHNKGKQGDLGSGFAKDQHFKSGMNRIFKKTLVFLIGNLINFLLLLVFSLNFFSWNPFITIFLTVIYVSLTNIFYIIVVDRNYVVIGLIIQAVLMVLVNTLFADGFTPITLIATGITIFLSYFTYVDLEKTQIASRLFSITHLTAETTRALLNVVILVITITLYNSMVNTGGTVFIDKNFLDPSSFVGTTSKSLTGSRDYITDLFFIDGLLDPKMSLNYRLMNKNFVVENNFLNVRNGNENVPAAFKDFIAYAHQDQVFKNAELGDCQNLALAKDCKQYVSTLESDRIVKIRDEKYSDFGYLDLTQKIDLPTYRKLTKYYYLDMIKQFETEKNYDNTSPIGDIAKNLDSFTIKRKQIFPAIIAVSVFMFFMLFKFILAWLVTFITSIIWQILKFSGFVNIDIEVVEAEIVSI